MNTAVSGYIQRKIVKLTEDIKIQYDGTVRDVLGSIYQLSYGDDGIDPKEVIKVDGSFEPCNISNLVTKLNDKYEVNTKNKKLNKDTDDIFKNFEYMKI